jgi:ribose transport system substrate-binding protein
MGAYQALAAAGKAEKTMVFGFDGAADVIDSIRDKKIIATGMQFPKVIAAKAAEMADLYLKGEGDFPKKLPVEVELVNQENIERYSAYGKNK